MGQKSGNRPSGRPPGVHRRKASEKHRRAKIIHQQLVGRHVAVHGGVLFETLRQTVHFRLLDWREDIPLPRMVRHLLLEVRIVFVACHLHRIHVIRNILQINAFLRQLRQNVLRVVELVGAFRPVERRDIGRWRRLPTS